jgi:ferric-dicitrate binding protein FerR (iron transport regulator)
LPKGSKPIRLVLADGSLVWLNAASSITYPTAFIGQERRVSITGEAYFEVSENKAMPFFVEHNQLLVKVLGTHFNVNTYENEASNKVTLLSGLVDVGNGKVNRRLLPGQQASVSTAGFSVKENTDTDEVMAWKNGQFYFGGSDIKSIMKQIERYYDVEVEFRDEVPYQFVAKISRDVNVSAFLEKLELTNLIHFKIEGKKIIVMK